MYPFIKSLHVIGIALFLGSILGHAIGGLAENVGDSAQTQLVARQIIDVATWYLTVPGLAMLALSGILMLVLRGWSQLEMRWMLVHLVIAVLIVLNALFILFPTGQGLLEVVAKGGDMQALLGREALFGALNIMLSLAAIFIAVIRPRLGRKEG